MRTAIIHVLIILVLGAIHASPLLGQKQPKPGSPGEPQAAEATEGSARWWTLTDEITPQELRAIHEDVEGHKERYRESVRAGTRRSMSKKRMEVLDFFIDGSSHPELFQMWSVFDGFAISFGNEEADPRASLAEFGFKGEALENLAHFCSEYWREREILMKEFGEKIKPVAELARLSRESLGEDEFTAAVHTKDSAVLAAATGYGVERVEELLEIWGQTPAEDFAVQSLPVLKELLGPTDWNRFRSYLLAVRAPKMSSISTAIWE